MVLIAKLARFGLDDTAVDRMVEDLGAPSGFSGSDSAGVREGAG
jgi:hypothetical protein